MCMVRREERGRGCVRRRVSLDILKDPMTYQTTTARVIQRYIFDIQREADVTEGRYWNGVWRGGGGSREEVLCTWQRGRKGGRGCVRRRVSLDILKDPMTYQRTTARVIQRYIFDIQREADVTEGKHWNGVWRGDGSPGMHCINGKEGGKGGRGYVRRRMSSNILEDPTTYQKTMQRIIQRYVFDIQREAEVTEGGYWNGVWKWGAGGGEEGSRGKYKRRTR